jgi:hypothetical protein
MDEEARHRLAVARTTELIAACQLRAGRAWRGYYVLQVLTVALAAITPCLIFLAKDNPENTLVEWLQLFFPAIAATTAGISHVFRLREDGVRYEVLAEALRSELWRYETRTGDCGPALSDADAIDYLVGRVADLHLQTVNRRGAELLSEPADGGPGRRREGQGAAGG